LRLIDFWEFWRRGKTFERGREHGMDVGDAVG
jgi:hypothetical protein